MTFEQRPEERAGAGREISGGEAFQVVGAAAAAKSLQSRPTPGTAAYQAPSMGFTRQEYWSGVPLPSPPGGGKSR